MSRDSRTFFISFVNSLNASPDKNVGNLDSNYSLIKKLIELEDKAKQIIAKDIKDSGFMQRFISQFTKASPNEKAVSIKYGNVYFRERQTTFYGEISTAIRQKNAAKILKYRTNYNFINWAIKNFQGTRSSKLKLRRCFNKINQLRERLVLDNAYMVLNRVRVMSINHVDYSLKYMDVVQSCFIGLLEAVDNFVPLSKDKIKKSDVNNFIPVVICRVTLNFRDVNNTSLLKASTKDWRIIYRIKLAVKKGHTSVEDIYNFVAESFPEVAQDTVIVHMQFIDSVKSSAYLNRTDDGTSSKKDPVDEYIIENYQDCVDGVEENHDHVQLSRSLDTLSVLEKKCILLKYGKLLS